MRISAEKLRPKFLLSRVLWKTGLSRLLAIDRGDYKMRFFPTGLSAGLWVDPAPRGEEILLRHFLRRGDTVVDVGANIGTAALTAAALVQEPGIVVAVEPNPKTFSYLKGNLEFSGLGNVRIFQAAADRLDGTVSITDKALDFANRIVDSGGVQTPAVTLDSLLSQFSFDRIELLKIDAEGYEQCVLEGAPRTLEKTRCVFFECIEAYLSRYGSSVADLQTWLIARGFQLFRSRTVGKGDLIAVRDSEILAERAPRLDLFPCFKLNTEMKGALAEPHRPGQTR